MTILVLAPQPFFQNRGTPIAVRLLVETLATAGHTVHLLVFSEGEDVRIPNVTLHRIPALPGLGSIRPGFSLKKIGCDILLAWQCFRLLRKIRFDYVHAVEESVFIAMAAKRLFSVPYIYDLDSWLSDQLLAKLGFLRPIRPLFEACERAAVRNSIGVVPVCRALEDKIRSFDTTTPLLRLEDISLLDGRDSDRHEPLREGTGCRGKMMLYVGNLERYQGIDLLLQAFSRVDTPECCLVCIGGATADIDTYKEKALRMGIADRVHLIGPRPVTDLGMYLRQADLLVSPRTEGENTPMKIYSYMDSGRPILATRIASHTQVLDADTAFLADPDPDSMAAALREALGDTESARRKALAAKRKVEAEYSRAAYEKKLLRFYDELTHVRNLRL